MTNELRHTPKLRLLSAFLAAAMTLTTLPAAAFAADVTDYELAVNGKRVTSANATNILDDGKASYDAVTRTLTLSGDISATDNAVNPFGEQITVDGNSTLTLTDGQKELYAGLCGTKTINVAAGADITLDAFGYGISYAGADISGNVTIRNVDFGITSGGATIQSTGKLVIEKADKAVSGGGAKVYGTLEIDETGTAVSDSGVTVYEGGVVTITGATSGLNGRSEVDGGSLSVSATTCIDNGEVIFKSGTLKLDSANNETIALNKLTVNAPNFWYRTATDGAWTQVTGGSWTRPDDAVYFEITTDDPAATHYTVTFDLNGGTNWDWISGGEWNNAHDRVSFPTQTGGRGEGLSISVDPGMGPKREGYEFVGWYTAAVGGEPVENQSYYYQDQRLEPITENITLYAHWQWIGEGPEPGPAPVPDETVVDGGDGSGFGAVLAVAGGAAVVGAAGFGVYELATRAILKDLLPEGTAIPATRGELALLLWQNAGRPEPAALPAFADTADTETAKAAQWCTEQGLLTAENGAFHPEQKVTKYRVIRVWKQAAAPQQ
ncbi:InlB B-repeat-containing protein [Faecalibacterium wellingii]|uniref:InlB B-repeat-containing protein n=1 Tax=Faecalibacterium wellingii TaxID=2929491 RepID=A0ABU3TYP8_9FIRM|nr:MULTISPECIES: InlB B-repeat-containing protein [Faecalibacterium]MDU8688429.1 InlB B-repeat-containing protein [Faecalibacterium prausnitzii]UQK55487.1 InlB B-repeat-containing protein [Faecalibacterium sp. HTF-F]